MKSPGAAQNGGWAQSRREFLKQASLAGAGLLLSAAGELRAQAPDANAAKPDYRIEIAETDWEIAPKKRVRTTAYDGQVPGRLLRLKEGKPVTIEITNHADHEEIVHWHGQWIPVAADGAMEEGAPMIPVGATTRISFTPRPAGLHWYHTHAMGSHGMMHGLYTGQFGMLLVETAAEPGDYDQEQFIALHDWEPYTTPSDDGALMVQYVSGTVNGRQLGEGEPIRVREGQRVLFHILNASATEPHWISLPSHEFEVIALDGRPVGTKAKVKMLRLGPAERVSALVTMNAPGIWVLGEAQGDFRKAGMGVVVEYAGRTGKPIADEKAKLKWDYRAFADQVTTTYKPDVTVPLVFTSRFRGHGAMDEWMINGKSFPSAEAIPLRTGLRHRLVFENRSQDNHPVHIHRHNFELVSMGGVRMSGVHKDVVVVDAGATVEADLVANNPGNTLFHCHQQDHMDAGFMTLFHYA